MLENNDIKTVARIYHMGEEEPILEAYVSHGPQSEEKVEFTDEELAKRLGLTDATIHTKYGDVTPNDGVDYVRNIWRMFAGSSTITGAHPVLTSHLIAPTRHERSSERGEPAIDPMEDIEGQYRRFQERGRK